MSRFEDVQIKLLHDICMYSYNPGSISSFYGYELDQLLPKKLIPGIALVALGELLKKGYLITASGRYMISANGIKFIEESLEDPSSEVSRIVSAFPGSTSPAGTNDTIPAADRVVTLDHNSKPYSDAIRALDEAVATFKEDKLLDNEWGPEKRALLRTIEAGRELLKEGQVRVATIFSTIVMPLRVVCQKYQDAIAEGMAKAVAEQIMHRVSEGISAILSLLGLK